MRKSFAIGTILLIVLAAPALQAQETEKNFTGYFLFGYRLVDTGGAYNKYKEDYNLEKGARLFNFNLSYTAPESLSKLFDRVDLNVYNFGGDPFESISLSIQKSGLYKFKYDRRKSTYFYDDLHQIGPQVLYDLHRFDFDRVADSGSLTLTLAKPVSVFMSFDRYTKRGESTTSLDIERTEFEFDKPISEKLTEVAFGLDLHVPRYALVFEERMQDYENTNSFLLPGYADGGAGATLPSALNSFQLDQPYDFKTNVHSLRLNARPLDSLLIRGSARMSKQDTHLAYTEEAIGIDYLDRRFATSAAGSGTFKRDIQLYDFDATYLLFTKLAVVGAVRYNTFSQDGTLTVGSTPESADFGFKTLGIEGGLQYQFSPALALTLGYRNEQRKLDNLETVTYAEETVRNGFFGNVKWNLKTVKFTLDYQRGNTDDPYTLISPTQFDRLRFTARYELKGFSASASYLMAKIRNEIEGGVNFRILYASDPFADIWKSSNNQFNLRLGYRDDRIDAFFGYSFIEVKHDSDRSIEYPPSFAGPGGAFSWTIAYEGRSNLFEASIAGTLSQGWKLGAYMNRLTNQGSWPIERTTVRAYLEHTFAAGVLGQLAYRYMGLKETDSGFNNYSASILEISFGYRWQ